MNPLLTKADFADQFDYEALSKATQVRVYMKNGDVFRVHVHDYWPTGEYLTDFLDGMLLNDDGGFVLDDQTPQHYTYKGFLIPHPDIDHIEVLSSIDKPNHGSHPEVGFVVEKINDLYNR